jgi:ATP-dependent RNA helicase DeaD
MGTFDDLGVTPELVEALAAEGIEVPTEIQEASIPLLLRGNSLLVQAGSGAGTLVTYGIPLLQALDPEATSPGGLVLAPSPEAASNLAASLSRLAMPLGHRIAALGSPWALPELAGILFAAPEDLLAAVQESRISLDGVTSVVVDGFPALTPQRREALEILFGLFPKEGQRVILGQPLTDAAEVFGRAHLHRAVHVPPRRAAQGEASPSSPRRGDVHYRVVGEAKDVEVIQTVANSLDEGFLHVLLFLNTDDQAADMGDFLALHGYLSGPPGDGDFPVWLGVEELEARKVLSAWEDPQSLVTVSVDVPFGPDSLDRRHGGQERSVVLVRSRELPHLKDVARRTGYRLVPAPEPLPTRVAGELDRLTDLLERTLQEESLAPHYLALQPLFLRHSPAEVAAAALALLQRRPGTAKVQTPDMRVSPERPPGSGPPPKSWVRLFVGVGEKDGVGPGDLLGAITGEAALEGSQIGKIEIRDTFSLVEVSPASADRIIRAVNGTTIRGRAVRVDYDRGGPKGRPAPGGRGGAGGRSGPGGRGGSGSGGASKSGPASDTRGGPGGGRGPRGRSRPPSS